MGIPIQKHKTPLIIILLVLLTAALSFYRINHLPALVKSNLEARFPGDVEYKWYKEDGLYKIVILHQSGTKRFYFDPKGDLVKLIEQIEEEDLPTAVQDQLHSHYPNYTIGEIEKIHAGDTVNFELMAHNGSLGVQLILDDQGSIIDEIPYRASAKGEYNVR